MKFANINFRSSVKFPITEIVLGATIVKIVEKPEFIFGRRIKMDKEFDKLVESAIEEAFIQQREQYFYEDEVVEENYCCDDCVGQAAYFIRKG